jgi:hypothetical protein
VLDFSDLVNANLYPGLNFSLIAIRGHADNLDISMLGGGYFLA